MIEMCTTLRQRAAAAALNDLPDCAEAMLQAADLLERIRFAGRNVIKAAETSALCRRHIEQLCSALDSLGVASVQAPSPGMRNDLSSPLHKAQGGRVPTTRTPMHFGAGPELQRLDFPG